MMPTVLVRLENGLFEFLDNAPDGLYPGEDASIETFLTSYESGQQFLSYC